MKIRVLLASTAALALAACGDANDQAAQQNAESDLPAATDTAAPALDAGLPTTAQEFAAMQASSDAYEIEAGRLAQENATNQAVKDFGAMMVKDHTTSTAELETAAGQAEGVTVQKQMNAQHQSNLDALRNAGANFDRTYMDQQVRAHEQALAMLQNYARQGDSQPLKDFATKTASVVQGHLEQARQLQQQTQQQGQQTPQP